MMSITVLGDWVDCYFGRRDTWQSAIIVTVGFMIILPKPANWDCWRPLGNGTKQNWGSETNCL